MTIDVLKRLAHDAEKGQRFEDALNLYRLALANAEETGRRATVPPLQVRVGDLLLRLGQPAAAVPLFTDAGHAYARRGMGPEVVAIGDRVLRAAPGGVRVFLAWARTLFEHGHSATATAVLEVFVRRNPEPNAKMLREAAARMSRDPLRVLVEDVARVSVGLPRPSASEQVTAPIPAASDPEPARVDAPARVGSDGRTGDTEPRVPIRVNPFTVGSRSPQTPLRPRPGAPGWRDPPAPIATASSGDEEDLDQPLMPRLLVPNTPFQGGEPTETGEKAAPVQDREAFFRRVPRSRWRPLLEVTFWLAAAAITVFLLVKARIL